MKGISVVERHFEKAATLLVAVSVFGYLAWDFLSPTTFKMGSKSDVTPATANEILLQKALSVQKQQAGENTLEFEPIQKGVTQEAFTQKLNANITAPDRLSANAPSLAKKLFCLTSAVWTRGITSHVFRRQPWCRPWNGLGTRLMQMPLQKMRPCKNFLPVNRMPIAWM